MYALNIEFAFIQINKKRYYLLLDVIIVVKGEDSVGGVITKQTLYRLIIAMLLSLH